jgi:hypothetical protein
MLVYYLLHASAVSGHQRRGSRSINYTVQQDVVLRCSQPSAGLSRRQSAGCLSRAARYWKGSLNTVRCNAIVLLESYPRAGLYGLGALPGFLVAQGNIMIFLHGTIRVGLS